MAKTLYRAKYDLLISWGFLHWEAREFARQYTTKQIRTLPYMKHLTAWRRLYISGFKKRGFTTKEIRDRLKDLYQRRGWLKDGKFDPWAMLRYFRKAVIDSGGEPSPGRAPRRGSHHKTKGISKGDLKLQKKRRQERVKANIHLGDRNRWVSQLQENRKKALAEGNTELAFQLAKQIARLKQI